jgi:uroporphyrinogen decarboxylase
LVYLIDLLPKNFLKNRKVNMQSQSSTERVWNVLNGQIPDRVPVLMQNFQNVANLMGLPIGDFCRSAELMAEAHLAAWNRFQYDILDLENGTVALAEALGCEVEYPEMEPPHLLSPALNSLDEVDRLKPINPTRDGTLPQLILATRLVAERLKGQACIVGEADQGAFSLAAMLLGMEKLLVSLMDPSLSDKIHCLLEFCYQQVKSLALAQFDAGASFTQIGDSIAGPDVCSPKIYQKYACPYEKRLVKELAAKGVPLILHICGDSTRIISDMARTGAQMLEVDYTINAEKCREATQGRNVLVGNVDPSNVMTLNGPRVVIEACRTAIQTMGKQGWFILSTGCTLPATTPAENVEAMMEAARRYGRYGPEGLIVIKS